MKVEIAQGIPSEYGYLFRIYKAERSQIESISNSDKNKIIRRASSWGEYQKNDLIFICNLPSEFYE